MSNTEPIQEYDSNGNWIYRRDSDGFEEWHEYDTKGNCIHYRNSNGTECWREYDTKSNMIHYRDSYGYEIWHEYDTKSNMIHYRDSNGVERRYDADGNVIDRPIKKKDNDTVIDKPTEKKDNSTMNEYYIKVNAESIESIDEALGEHVGKNGISGYFVLTENGHSCAICHSDSHLYVERNEADDLAEYLLNKDDAYLKPRTGDKFYTENDD